MLSLFKRDPMKKYVEIFGGAKKMGQSLESCLKQAVDAAVKDGVFPDKKTAANEIAKKVTSYLEPGDLSEMERAKKKAAL
ncbi:MAG: hypothetical protein IMX01_01215 [Limnochordaceae bacterium]|nr:hypothetical protein [Limnochordaceae bacterium]